MILIHSVTLRIKFQGEFFMLFHCFVKSCAPIPAFVKARGRAFGGLRNSRQQDHSRDIHGNALHSSMFAVHTHKQKLILGVKESLS